MRPLVAAASLVSLLCAAAHSEEVAIEAPAFTEPVQSFSAPVQSGAARRAQAPASGLYSVSDLQGKLYCVGRPLPVLDGGLVFVRTADDFYEGGAVVWAGDLSISGEPGSIPPPQAQARIAADGSFVAVCRAEVDEDFQHNYLKGVAPNWYFGPKHNLIGVRKNEDGERLPNVVTVTVAVPAPLAQGRGELAVALNSDAPPEKGNTLTVSLNGTVLYTDHAWNGPGYRILRCGFDNALLKDGDNSIQLTGDANYIKRLDWVEVSAPAQPRLRAGSLVVRAEADAAIAIAGARHGVDISDFGAESLAARKGDVFDLKAGRLYYFSEGAHPLEFGAEEKLARPVEGGVDYLAIGLRDSLPGLAPLLESKQADGLTTAQVALEDVLAVYNGGMYGPEGVRALIDEVKPRYVLLAGSFDRDCRRRQKNHQEDAAWQRGIPAYLHQLEQLTVTDDPYTLKQTVRVGRVPLNNKEALAAWAAKAAQHVPPDMAVLLAGTNKDMDFSANQRRQSPPVGAMVLDADGKPKDAVRKTLFDAMKTGPTLGIYQGHAQSWEIDAGLLDGSHAAAMPASSWVLATCNAGYYQGDFEVYLRDWMAAPSGGCVNALAPASIGTAAEQDQLIRQFFHKLRLDPVVDWGGMMQYLKRNLPLNEKTMNDPKMPDFVRKSVEEGRLTIDAFTLFGDPAARVLAPTPRQASIKAAEGTDPPELKLHFTGNWDAAPFEAGHMALEWQAERGAAWQPMKLAAPLKLGDNTVPFSTGAAIDTGGRFTVRLVEQAPQQPVVVWAKGDVIVDSRQPGVPNVVLRQRPPKVSPEPAVVMVARNPEVMHRGEGVETQFELREKDGGDEIILQTDWLQKRQFAHETELPAENFEARARWRKNGIEGEWSEWGGVPAQGVPLKEQP